MTSHSLPVTPPLLQVSAFLISISQSFTECWHRKENKKHKKPSQLCAIHVNCEEPPTKCSAAP